MPKIVQELLKVPKKALFGDQNLYVLLDAWNQYLYLMAVAMSSPSFMRFVDLQVLLPKPAATSPPEGSQTTLQDRVEDAGGLPPSDDEQSRAVQCRCHQLKYTSTEKVNTIFLQYSFLSCLQLTNCKLLWNADKV